MIRIENLNLVVGNTAVASGSFALRDLSLHIKPEEYFVLLGPTGSGKTLLLESLCGLNRINSGRIEIDGVDVTLLEPRHRHLGYLPQDYALFPHKTVRKNIAFGLENQPSTAASIEQQVLQLMELLHLTHLADRYPEKLSGGEKQRVALARALAIEPKVLLLDEPVSALDEQTRDNVCRQLRLLQRRAKTTAVHVCHNFAEMLTVADRVGIIDGGQILQVGTPQEILRQPRNARIARFVQAGNLFTAQSRIEDSWLRLTCPGGLELSAPISPDNQHSGTLSVMVRPESIRLGAKIFEHLLPGTSLIEGTVDNVTDLGPLVRIDVVCDGGAALLVSLGRKEYNDQAVDPGERIYLAVAPEDVHVMVEETLSTQNSSPTRESNSHTEHSPHTSPGGKPDETF